MNFPKQFIKFAIVGTINTLVNLTALYILTDFFHVYYLISAIFAFAIAVTNSFIMNSLWTFKTNLRKKPLQRYSRFIIISLIALASNLLLLYLLTEIFEFYYLISQLIAIAISLWINFFGNKKWTFHG